MSYITDKDIAIAILQHDFPEQQTLLKCFLETKQWKFNIQGSNDREETLRAIFQCTKNKDITDQIAKTFMENGIFRFPSYYAASIGMPELDGPGETLINEVERKKRKENACKKYGLGRYVRSINENRGETLTNRLNVDKRSPYEKQVDKDDEDTEYAEKKNHYLSAGIYPTDIDQSGNYSEGAVEQVLVNAYERNSAARNECLKIHGYKCKVCDFDFEEYYGDIGRGFIHVHHLVPLSDIGHEYVINPETDLVPVCPNCHHMLHREKPVLSPEGLKEIIFG